MGKPFIDSTGGSSLQGRFRAEGEYDGDDGEYAGELRGSLLSSSIGTEFEDSIELVGDAEKDEGDCGIGEDADSGELIPSPGQIPYLA